MYVLIGYDHTVSRNGKVAPTLARRAAEIPFKSVPAGFFTGELTPESGLSSEPGFSWSLLNSPLATAICSHTLASLKRALARKAATASRAEVILTSDPSEGCGGRHPGSISGTAVSRAKAGCQRRRLASSGRSASERLNREMRNFCVKGKEKVFCIQLERIFVDREI